MTTSGLERPQVKGPWGIPGGEADSDHVGVEQRTEAEDTGHRSKGRLIGKCDGQESSPKRLLRMSGDGCGQVKGAV